jgi:hypothetical protein
LDDILVAFNDVINRKPIFETFSSIASKLLSAYAFRLCFPLLLSAFCLWKAGNQKRKAEVESGSGKRKRKRKAEAESGKRKYRIAVSKAVLVVLQYL